MHCGWPSDPVIALLTGRVLWENVKPARRHRAGLIRSGGSISLHPLWFRLDLRAFRSSRSSLSPHVVDHETTHDRAERQALGMRPAIGSLRRFNFEHEGKKRPVGGADQPPLVLWLAVPGLSPALYARYRNQSRSLRVQLNCGVAKESLADDGATERQSGAAPGSSPEADTASFKEIVPDINRAPASTAPGGGVA